MLVHVVSRLGHVRLQPTPILPTPNSPTFGPKVAFGLQALLQEHTELQ